MRIADAISDWAPKFPLRSPAHSNGQVSCLLLLLIPRMRVRNARAPSSAALWQSSSGKIIIGIARVELDSPPAR